MGTVCVGRAVVIAGDGVTSAVPDDDVPFSGVIPIQSNPATNITATTTPTIMAGFGFAGFIPSREKVEEVAGGCVNAGGGGGGDSNSRGDNAESESCAVPQYSQNLWSASISFPHAMQNGIQYDG